MHGMRATRVIGLLWMAVWSIASLMVIAFNNQDLRESDGLFLPFLFPGFLFPFNLGPVDLSSSNAWSSVADVALDAGIGPYGVIDLLTVGLAVASVVSLFVGSPGVAKAVVRAAGILGVAHVVIILNSALFSASGYDEHGTYAVGAAAVLAGVVLVWWPHRTTQQALAGAPQQPAPMVGAPLAGAPTAATPPAGALTAPATMAGAPVGGTAQYVVQTAAGQSGWLTWEQVVWMARNNQLQPTDSIYDGVRQTWFPAGTVPGLFAP